MKRALVSLLAVALLVPAVHAATVTFVLAAPGVV